jgi:hypothetical protein
MAKRSTYKKMASSVKKAAKSVARNAKKVVKKVMPAKKRKKAKKGEEALTIPHSVKRPLTAMLGALFII